MNKERVVYDRETYLEVGYKKGLKLLNVNIDGPITNKELEERLLSIGVGEGTKLMSYVEGRFLIISKSEELPLIFGDHEHYLVDCDGVLHGPHYYDDDHFFILE